MAKKHKRIRLEDSIGNFMCTVTPDQMRLLLAKGAPFDRVGATAYREKRYVMPSISKETPCVLRPADLEALIGLRNMDAIRQERLIGWGLLKEIIPSFARGVRTSNDPCPEYRGPVDADGLPMKLFPQVA